MNECMNGKMMNLKIKLSSCDSKDYDVFITYNISSGSCDLVDGDSYVTEKRKTTATISMQRGRGYKKAFDNLHLKNDTSKFPDKCVIHYILGTGYIDRHLDNLEKNVEKLHFHHLFML